MDLPALLLAIVICFLIMIAILITIRLAIKQILALISGETDYIRKATARFS